jgi:hypothetical protein
MAERVTGEQVEAAMVAAGIKRMEHHECSMCRYPTAYLRRGPLLFFDQRCHCTDRYEIAPRDWGDATEWTNMQIKTE